MKLIAMTDDSHTVHELASKLTNIHQLVDYIHIREKSKTAHEILLLVNLLVQLGVNKEKIVIHDRLDIALLTDNPNIHLPSHSLPVKEVRASFPHLRIGRSVHSLSEAKQAEADGADYVLYGHCFETNCKEGIVPNGVHALFDIKKELQIPVFAIGGITPERVYQLREAKADGIAIMSGIFSSDNPYKSALIYSKKCQEYEYENKL
ncbi:thiazole tautomerase TenI [Lysinibacillus sp. NPDC096418]|uniref:thiazole tautomerase TenI n=1 Tax=Lysinibacillus sp. NPDC096418 TaxID=3364138 RepID=UPI003821EAA1